MTKLRWLLPALVALAIAGCGGGHTTATATSHVTGGTRCEPGDSFMGCSQPAPGFALPHYAFPAGRKFIDVSNWQPNVDWSAVKRAGIIGVVVKAGEGSKADPTFTSHIAGARRAGLPVQAYWFERPIGCSAEAAAIDRTVPKGIRVTFDEEVPGLAGYAACQRAAVRSHTGFDPVEYTSPGTLSDRSSLSLWEATYGPSLSVLWHPLVAWQFTNAASVAGLHVDESVDYGLFAEPAPKDIGGAQHYERYPNNWWRLDGEHLRERANVMRWDANHCENPVRRKVCVETRHHLILLLGRDQAVYRRETKAQRNANHLPGRIQGLSHRINNGRGVVRRWL